jgi:osmotically-inducible protein OsmY
MTILANVNLREQVESELQWDPQVVVHGIVTFQMKTHAQRLAAENAAWSARGVANVENRIEVIP